MDARSRAAASRPPPSIRRREPRRGRFRTDQPSFRIVKDHAYGMAVAGAYPAHAMAQVNTVGAARPLHRAMMHSKGDRISLRERHHFGARLHTRPLLGQHEFATSKIAPR